MTKLLPPFPYFGGKRRVAAEVWRRFGDVRNYVEPFFGSGAVLLGRPTEPQVETVNDADGFVSNFWRAVQSDPAAVAEFANTPTYENEKHARHLWLLKHKADLPARLEGDPYYYDAQIAGWWAWGARIWIGGGWCSGRGPWHSVDGRMVRDGDGPGVTRQMPRFNADGTLKAPITAEHIRSIAERMRNVAVCCGDWTRVTGRSVLGIDVTTGVFLDPPYAGHETLYSKDGSCSEAVRAWAIEHGDAPGMRIALCGYEDEHDMPYDWSCYQWAAQGGYGLQGNGEGRSNRKRERIWFSPHCLKDGGLLEDTLL